MTQRQGLPSRCLRAPLRAVLAAAGFAATAVLAACGGPTPASGQARAGPADGDAIKIVARDNEFQPEALELEAGAEATIEVANEGGAAHNLVIAEIGLSTGTIESGEAATATFTVPDTPAAFHCSFHPGMEGEITLAGS